MNQQTIKLVTQALAEEYGDFSEHAKDIGTYLEANPRKKAALLSAETDETEKYDILEGAFLKVTKSKERNSTAAAKTAGTVEAKRQEAMKTTTVTAGSGAGKRNDAQKDPADQWLEEVQGIEKHNELFKN